MSEDMEKQRVTKDDGRYQVFYSFKDNGKQAGKCAPSSIESYNDHASNSGGGRDNWASYSRDPAKVEHKTL